MEWINKDASSFSFQIRFLTSSVEIRELSHLTRDLSQLRRKWLLLPADKLTKWQLWSFWVKYMSYCAFAQLLSTFNFFSAWDKSRVKWDNSHNSTQKMKAYKKRVCRKNKNCSKETINTLLLFDFHTWNFSSKVLYIQKTTIP